MIFRPFFYFMQNKFKYITKESLTYDFLHSLLKDYYSYNKIIFRPSTLDADTERCLRIISDVMYRQRVYKKYSTTEYKKEWVSLNSRILISQTTNHYKRLIDFLTLTKILLVYKNNGKESYLTSTTLKKHHNYVFNVSSKKYKLNEKYLFDNTITCPYKNKKVIYNIKNTIAQREKMLSPVYKHLQTFLTGLTLLPHKYPQKHNDIIQYFYSQSGINDLVTDASGRQYTKLTNLPSKSRKYLRYKGKKLVSIDIANSQPLLLLPLIEHSDLVLTTEIYKYKNLVETGTFYNFINNKLKTPKSIQSIKKAIFKHIFFNYNHKYTNEIIETFKKEFPTIFNWILNNSTYKDELSFKLRKSESNIWINGISKMFMNKYPDKPIFILHDSLYVLEEDSAIAYSIVNSNYKEKNLNPSYHMEEIIKLVKEVVTHIYCYKSLINLIKYHFTLLLNKDYCRELAWIFEGLSYFIYRYNYF